jgi:hypothetical protein
VANYQLFAPTGEEINHNNLQEKGFWCEHGLEKEHVFVNKVGSRFGVEMNKDKDDSPYVPDLFQTHNQKIADLKTQNTPFFQSKQKYGISSQYAVTFNVKDYKRYSSLYPDIAIYFAVEWTVTKFVGYGRSQEVKPMRGVWWTDLTRIKEMVKTSPRHSYQQRVGDKKGNAKDSFIFDLRNEGFTKLL